MKGFKPSKVRFKSEKKISNISGSNKKVILIAAIALVAIIAIAAIVLLITSNVENKKINHINVSSPPNDREYYLNENLDLTGLIVQVVLNDGSYYMVNEKDVTVSGFNSKKENDNLTVTVSYQGCTDTFTVKVVSFPKAKPVPSYIEVKDYQKTYTLAEWKENWINLEKAYIELHYTDPNEPPYKIALTTDDIEGIPGQDAVPDTYTLTAYYEDFENGILFDVEFTITITNN